MAMFNSKMQGENDSELTLKIHKLKFQGFLDDCMQI